MEPARYDKKEKQELYADIPLVPGPAKLQK